MHRVLLIDIANPHIHKEDADKELKELSSLVKTYGGVDIVHIIQHRTFPDKATFIGSGKVIEVADIVKRKQISLVILNAIANPSQVFRLTQKLWTVNPTIEVWDRVDLILHIFDKHARNAESKLQIEIARMNHMGPRMYGLGGTLFSRQGGGIGSRGEGETNIELMKRHWKDQIKEKRKELEKAASHRARQMERRKEKGLMTVSIVGYTNSGKTSLFNLLTKKKKEIRDALFVTLDSTIGKLYLPHAKQEILISDTIGFIQNLPPFLVDAFKSTLMESIHADLLLHLIDAADNKMKEKIDIVEHIIQDLGICTKKRVFVFNKVDALKGDVEKTLKNLKKDYELFNPKFISVTKQLGIDKLVSMIEENLSKQPLT